MARPISDTHRRISAGFIGSYLGKRNQCLRDVVLWMLAGPDSSRSGLLRVHVGALADDLGHSKPAVTDALTRLHSDGHIVWDADNRMALCWFVIRNVTLPAETNRKSYLAECNFFNECAPRSEAIKWIQAIEITVANGAQRRQQSSYQSKPLSSAQQRTENREQRTPSSSAIATEDTPAVAVVAQAVELELTAPAKPARTLTAGQQDAIFAKQMIRMFADRWNEVMAKHCAPVVAKSLYLKATTLAKNCAVIKHIDEETTPGADLSKLYEWAQARHDYHAGKTGRAWTFEAWHAADHLAQVFADYRQERLQAGGPKNFAFNVDRTLTQWRESVEYRQTREADHGA